MPPSESKPKKKGLPRERTEDQKDFQNGNLGSVSKRTF